MTYQVLKINPLLNSKERKVFVDFYFNHYQHEQNFASQPRMAHMDLLKSTHPFYATAKCQFFLAKDQQGNIVGRIAAIINNNNNEIHQEKVVFFGFYETKDDLAITKGLLDKVAQFGQEHGMDEMRGPVNPSTNYESALLVEGFDDPPQIMMTFNHPYYQDHLESLGLEKSMDLLAYNRRIKDPFPETVAKIAARVEKKQKVTYRHISKKRWDRDIAIMQDLYNQAWIENWGFVPMTQEEFSLMAKELKMVVDPELVLFCYVDDKPAGFVVGLPDLNQVLIKLKKGRLFPFAWHHLLFASKKIFRFRLITMGVLKEYRQLGLGAIMYQKMYQIAVNKGYEYAECSWILETNQDMRRPLERMGAWVYKRYRIYQTKLQKF